MRRAGLGDLIAEEKVFSELVDIFGNIMGEWRAEGPDANATPFMDHIRAVMNRVHLMPISRELRARTVEVSEVGIMHMRLTDPRTRIAENWKRPPRSSGRRRNEAVAIVVEDVREQLREKKRKHDAAAVWQRMLFLAKLEADWFTGVEYNEKGEPAAVQYHHHDGNTLRIPRKTASDIINRMN